MAYPTLAVKVMFDKGPYDDDPGATTLTTVPVLAFKAGVGRTPNSEVTQPGAGAITVDNRARLYDPSHSAGAHYGDLLPGRQVQVKATWSGVDYFPFVGFVEAWPQNLTAGFTADIDIPLVDTLGLVALGDLPTSVYAATVAADEPLAWWRLDENEGTVLHDSTGNGHDGTYTGGATFNHRDGLIAGDDDNAIGFDHRTQYATAPFLDLSPFPAPVDPTAVDALTLVYEIWQQGRIRQDATALPHSYPFLLAGRAGPELLWIGYSTDRKLRVGIYPMGVLHEFDVTASKISPRHIVVAVEADTTTFTPHVWVNGEEQTGTPISIGTTDRSVLGVSLASAIAVFPAGDTPDLILDEAAVYPAGTDISVLAPAHHTAGTAPWNGDGTLDRLTNVLELLDLTGLEDPTAYPGNYRPTTLGSATIGDDPVAYLQRLETTEAGRLVTSFNTTDGPRLRLQPRAPTLPSVTAVLTDEDTPTALHYSRIDIDPGETFIVNEVTVNWGGDPDNAAGSVTVRDTDSIGIYGIRHTDVATLHANPGDATAYGQYVLAREAQPRRRITLNLDPVGDNRLWPTALGAALGQRMQVKLKPLNVGTRVTADCLLDGYSHDASNGRSNWITQLQLTEIPASDLAGYLRIDVSEIGDPDFRPYL